MRDETAWRKNQVLRTASHRWKITLFIILETYTSSEIIAQATTFTILVVVPASLFRNIPLFPLSNCFDYGCNVIYYIGTAIRSNGDLLFFSKTYPSFLTVKEGFYFLTKPLFPQGREDVAGYAIAFARVLVSSAEPVPTRGCRWVPTQQSCDFFVG